MTLGIFRTSNIEIVKAAQFYFGRPISLPSVVLCNRINKWPAVAAQTARSCCKALSIQCVYYFIRCLFATQAEHEYKIQIQIEIQRKNRN